MATHASNPDNSPTMTNSVEQSPKELVFADKDVTLLRALGLEVFQSGRTETLRCLWGKCGNRIGEKRRIAVRERLEDFNPYDNDAGLVRTLARLAKLTLCNMHSGCTGIACDWKTRAVAKISMAKLDYPEIFGMVGELDSEMMDGVRTPLPTPSRSPVTQARKRKYDESVKLSEANISGGGAAKDGVSETPSKKQRKMSDDILSSVDSIIASAATPVSSMAAGTKDDNNLSLFDAGFCNNIPQPDVGFVGFPQPANTFDPLASSFDGCSLGNIDPVCFNTVDLSAPTSNTTNAMLGAASNTNLDSVQPEFRATGGVDREVEAYLEKDAEFWRDFFTMADAMASTADADAVVESGNVDGIGGDGVVLGNDDPLAELFPELRS